MTGMRTLTASLLVLVLASPTLARAQSPYDLFQQALRQESVEGDLAAAIRLYGRVAEMEDRTLAARALLKMGESYERLGEAGALDAYRRVVRDYADQVAAADRARARLAELSPTAPAAADDDPPGIVTRQMWPNSGGGGAGPVDVGFVSPDGRYVGFTDWTPGLGGDENLIGHTDLALYDTETGRSRRLTNRPPPWVVGTYVEKMAWSADGERLAYTVWSDDWDHQEFHVVRSDGSGDRILIANRARQNTRPMAWSSDGDFIVALIRGWDQRNSIGLVWTDGGTVQVLETLSAHAPSALSLSADGRYVAYDYPQEDEATEHDVFVLSVDGSRKERLVSHPADDERPFFTPDGAHVVFVSDRSGRRGLYAVGILDGKATGEPELVRPDVGPIIPLGFDDSGALYYRLDVNLTDVYLAELDLNGTGALGEPTPLTRSFEGANRYPAWSPDGKRLAFFSHRGPGLGPYVVVATVDTGEEDEFALPFDPAADGYRGSSPAWSADGRQLFVEGRAVDVPDGPRRASYRLDLETGEVLPETYLRDLVGVRTAFRWATGAQAVGLRAAGVRFLPGSPRRVEGFRSGDEPLRPDEALMWFDGGLWKMVPGSEEEEIGPRGNVHTWAVSPDGTRLAWTVAEDPDARVRVVTMPLSGGPIHEVTSIARLGEDGQARGIDLLAWAPDGVTLLFDTPLRGERLERAPEIWRVSVEGGAPQRIDLPVEIAGVRFHPDGRRIAYWRQDERREIWRMEGFPWQNPRR